MFTALLLLTTAAWARPRTYCVGGYAGRPPGLTETACDTPDVRAQHSQWHHHIYVRRGDRCYDCWDERDNSCVTDFLTNNPDFSGDGLGFTCPVQDNAGEILFHVVDGQPVGAARLKPELSELAPGPRDAGETVVLVGALRDEAGAVRPVAGGRFRVTDSAGNTTVVEGQPLPDGTVRGEVTLPDGGDVRVAFEPDAGALRPGEQLADSGAALQLAVRPAVKLRLPAELDFGIVQAGSATRESCKRLDFSGSGGLGGRQLALALSDVQGCQARPVLAVGDERGGFSARPLEPGVEIEAPTPEKPWLDVCLQVPLCAGESSPPGAMLRISPPEGPASQAASIALRWRVQERSWLACNAYWLISLLVLGGALFAVVGFLRPRRFPAAATIQTAGSLPGLNRSVPRTLRECRGSSAGFYRDARLGVHADGSIDGRTRGCVALLQASAGGVILRPLGPLEVYDRSKKRWDPVSERDDARYPDSNQKFRIGDLYFCVDPG